MDHCSEKRILLTFLLFLGYLQICDLLNGLLL
jgi:hypothetical protein